jgi:hypothetical protein
VIKQCAIVRSLILKELSARDIMVELEGVYGHEAPSVSGVNK